MWREPHRVDPNSKNQSGLRAAFLVLKTMTSLRFRLFASGLHLAASVAIAALASVLVFWLWYPSPYAQMAGGVQLFLMVVAIDVVMGPALTAVIAYPGKPKRELARDLAVLVVLQFAALGYGLYTMAQARPVALMFEFDRLRVLSAVEVDTSQLANAPKGRNALPWTGPWTLAVVKPTDATEFMRTLDQELAGLPLAAQPKYWREYEPHAADVWRVAQPIQAMLKQHPTSADTLRRIADKAGSTVDALRFLPVQARQPDWVAVLAQPNARVIGFMVLPTAH
jgi:hypothetical protein